MAQPWLDDLSEEWVAQPTPPTVEYDGGDSITTQVTQSVPPKLRSRLPRMRQSSGSFSEIQVRQVVKDLRPPKSRNALAERSLSENNIPLNTSADPSHIASSRCASQSFSGASQDSIAYNGTVAQHTVAKSPVKDQATHETPEWRRRLLQGDIQYGDQKDLFSPMGLENIFQKPNGTSSAEDNKPKRRTGLFNDLSGMPSSPPPWPASEPNEEQHQCEDQDKSNNDESSHLRDTESFSMTNIPGIASQGAARTVSGQIEFENENFSPVYLTTNLKVGSTPKPTPNFRGSELANRLRQIGSPPASESGHLVEGNSIGQTREDSSFARLQEDSFPEGLPAGTPEFAEVGRFVELRRGGYSRDGSFRRRPLSPSPQAKVSQQSRLSGNNVKMNGTRSATQEEEESKTPGVTGSPKTPRRRGEQHLSPERAHNSTSPLKLFDAHDTFTSNRLQRRLSQLDYKSEKITSSDETVNRTEVKQVAQKTSRLTSVEEVSILHMATEAINEYQEEEDTRRVGTFGEGQLNEYRFSGDFSIMSSHPSEGLDSAPDESPSMDVAPPGSRQPLKFHYDESPMSREPSRAKRQGLTRVSNPFRKASETTSKSILGDSATESQLQTEIHHDYTEGKRGPTSPGKNPTPKRRRTIYSVDDDGDEDDDVFSDTGMKTLQDSHVAMQSVIGRKRKDARHDSSNNVADPDVLARRHILRPRNPTPSQRRRDEIQAEIMEATEAFILSSPKLNTIREQLEPAIGSNAPSDKARAAAVANEVAEFSMQRRQAVRDESRKKSVTTQDFLDEAVKIMDYIRAKGRPASGLDSLEETDSESPIKEHGNGYPSSSLTFERPPTREGRLSAWTEPNKRQLDPTVMSHLRKYQEKESDTFLNSSIHSLRFSRMRGPAPSDEQSILAEQDDIRITENINRRDHLQGTDDDRTNSQPRTAGTQHSTGSSLGLTVATSASRRSDHVPNLAPEAVAHLIPQEIAGMSFDKEKNIWVRQKSPSREHRPQEEESSGLNESEEDPFGNIPDLTVDETKEQEGLQKGSITRQQPTAETFMEETEDSATEKNIRPVTRDGQGIPPTETSSVPSKFSNFAWSYPKTETRATSYSEQEPRNWGTQKIQQMPSTQAIPESDEDEIEHEIQYYEGRGTARSTVRKTVRDITISIAERDLGETDDEPEPMSSPQRRGPQKWKSSNIGQKTQVRGAKTLPNARAGRRPIFEGEGELSLLEDPPSKNYRMQLSMSVSAPMLRQGHKDTLIPASSSPAKGDVTFMLSELPEFTLNQIDECELPDRVVVKHDGTRFSKALEDRYAQGTAELVKALQDAEPDEPYWEDLRQVDLHDRGLTNLHRLDEFCYRLEELDVSSNSVSQVKGIPYTMRRLTAHHNNLTGLTSWAMLMNLQHLDISNNDIDSLDGLSELVHLRTLKVNDNKINSLDGILHLDGLMELSASGNEIAIVDFSAANLNSLVDLDLRNNHLIEFRNVQHLSQLQHLNLDDNRIEEFPVFDSPVGKCNTLRSLRVCRNGMSVLELGNHFPKLESLYVDGNSLISVPGLEHLRYLRTFSARDQVLDTDEETEACVGGMMKNPDVRNLFISLNPSRDLELTQHLLNLQRLELSSMGLKELPDNFGQLTPNIRSINLNFNSLSDLRPLLNIKRLDELLLAGNKLERLRANAMVLGKLTTLSKLDWRDNPITLRFYSPASENRVMSLRQKPSDEQATDRFVLPDGDAEADKQYLSRLDYETRIRRRVTEMMLANFCKNLRELDGLPFNKARILVKDDVWERLLLLGVIQRKQADEIDEITE